MNIESIRLPCKISRGAFSGERVFEFALATGNQEYVGVAPLHYFKMADGRELTASEPPQGESIEGTLSAILINKNAGKNIAFVAIPDGEAVSVQAGIILACKPEQSNVPFRS